jgi:hypothetical protein
MNTTTKEQAGSPALSAEMIVASEAEILDALSKRFAVKVRPLRSGARRVQLTLAAPRPPRKARRPASTQPGVNPKYRLAATREQNP